MSDEVARPEIATCSFSEFIADMGTPVRTSNGAPRWKMKYEIRAVLRELMPDWSTMKWDKPRFTDAYFRKLDGFGLDVIQGRFEQIMHDLGGGPVPLVMLCFEKLHLPGKWCHRTLFAEWYQQQTGLHVPELGRTTSTPAPEPKKPRGEMTLF